MHYFNNLSLRNKIILPLVLVSVVTGVAFYFYFTNLYRESEIDTLTTKARAVILSAESAREFTADQIAFGVFKTDLKNLDEILRTVPIFAAMQVAEKKSSELGFKLKVPKHYPRNPKNEPTEDEGVVLDLLAKGSVKEVSQLNEKNNTLEFYRPVVLTKECLNCHGDPATSKALWGNSEGKDVTGTKMEGWKVGEVHGAFKVSMPLEPMQKAIAEKSMTIAGISLLSVIAIIAIGLFLVRVITRPIQNLLSASGKVADGDLTIEIPQTTNDEIGALSAAFSKMIFNLRDAMGQVSEATSAVASASAEISSSTEEMSAGAQEQSAQATEVAGAMEEMTATIIENSSNATNTADTAKKAKDAAEQGGAIVYEAVKGMRRIAEVVHQSANTVQTLGNSSEHIGEIISVIDEIADQTNLLALNAAIEAARAGEQGRGFAVVADEVRKLAERTSKATKEIAQMIKEIQTNTKEAVESMAKGTKEVEEGIRLADKAGDSLKDIVTISQKVTEMVAHISTASNEQTKTSESISRNVEGISAVTQETATGISQVARASEDLSNLTDNLLKLVSRFKLDDGGRRTETRPSSHQQQSALAVRGKH